MEYALGQQTRAKSSCRGQRVFVNNSTLVEGSQRIYHFLRTSPRQTSEDAIDLSRHLDTKTYGMHYPDSINSRLKRLDLASDRSTPALKNLRSTLPTPCHLPPGTARP